MKHADGPREGDVATAHHHHLATHAAQVGQSVARSEAAAVDDHVARSIFGRHLDAEANVDPSVRETLDERRQRPARIEMGFVGEEQSPAEAAGEIGLEGGDTFGIGPFEAFCTLGEPRQIGGIPRLGHHEAALADRAGKMTHPPADGGGAHRGDHGVRRRALAPGRQHAARLPRAASIAQNEATLDHVDVHAAQAQFQRAAKACDAGADHGDRLSFHSTNSRSFAGMIRSRFKGFSRTAVSARSLAETEHPSDIIEKRGLKALLSSREGSEMIDAGCRDQPVGAPFDAFDDTFPGGPPVGMGEVLDHARAGVFHGLHDLEVEIADAVERSALEGA